MCNTPVIRLDQIPVSSMIGVVKAQQYLTK